MSDPLDLNTLLKELQSAGQLDSTGAFTLAVDKSGRTLRGYQLQDPRLYSIFVVAAAVAAGATRVWVASDRKTLTYSFDANLPPFLFAQLGNWQSRSDRSDPGRLIHNLNLALLGASRVSRRVVLESSRPGDGHRLEMSGDDIVRSTLSARHCGPQPVTRLRLSEGLARTLGSFPETRRLLTLCRYAPLDLSVNQGASLTTAVGLGRGSDTLTAWRHLKAPDGNGTRLRVDPPTPGLAPGACIDECESPGPWSAVLALEDPTVAQRFGLLLVSDGITYRRESLPLGSAMACGVVAAPGLARNLSQSDLVENEEYHALMEQLRRQVFDLQLTRLRHSSFFPTPRLSRFYLEFAQQAAERADPSQLLELDLHANLIRLSETGGEWESAFQAWQTLPEGSPDRPGKLWQLAGSVDFSRQPLPQLAEFAELIRRAGDLAVLFLLAERLLEGARRCLGIGEFRELAGRLRMLCHLVPEMAGDDIRQALAASLGLVGEVSPALEVAPDGLVRSHLLRLQGERQEAQRQLELALESELPTFSQGCAYRYLADLAWVEGDSEGALKMLERAYAVTGLHDLWADWISGLWLGGRPGLAIRQAELAARGLSGPTRYFFLKDQAESARCRGGLVDWVRCHVRLSFTWMVSPPTDPCQEVSDWEMVGLLEHMDRTVGPDSAPARRARRLFTERLRRTGDLEHAERLAIRDSLIRDLFWSQSRWLVLG